MIFFDFFDHIISKTVQILENALFLGSCAQINQKKSFKIFLDEKIGWYLAIKLHKPGITKKTASKNIHSSLRKKLYNFVTIFSSRGTKTIENH